MSILNFKKNEKIEKLRSIFSDIYSTMSCPQFKDNILNIYHQAGSYRDMWQPNTDKSPSSHTSKYIVRLVDERSAGTLFLIPLTMNLDNTPKKWEDAFRKSSKYLELKGYDALERPVLTTTYVDQIVEKEEAVSEDEFFKYYELEFKTLPVLEKDGRLYANKGNIPLLGKQNLVELPFFYKRLNPDNMKKAFDFSLEGRLDFYKKDGKVDFGKPKKEIELIFSTSHDY
jgi:hypothetical protein